MPEAELLAGCEVDHIISRKHDGQTKLRNPAFSCERGNRAKGTDIGSVTGGQFTRFFNPRIDRWEEHFRLNGPVIEPLTEIGEVTVRLFRFNLSDRVMQRWCLQEAGAHPIS